MNKGRVLKICLTAMITALYLLLTLPFASFSYGPIQLRLAEALTALPVVSAAAIPGVFFGCLLANLLNPQNLGLIDILGGSLSTLAAAGLSYGLGRLFRLRHFLGRTSPAADNSAALPPEEEAKQKKRCPVRLLIALLPPVLLNALVVGSYLPWLISESQPAASFILLTIGSIFLSQALVVYALGLPLLLGLSRSGVVHKL